MKKVLFSLFFILCALFIFSAVKVSATDTGVVTITDGATDFLIYRLGCTADESETLVAGKEVVVCGKLINYKGNTPEMTSGGALISVADPEIPFDLVAPVITIADAALQQLAAATLYEGESLVDLFAGLKAAIAINDDVDGAIALTDEMIDLGGLDLLAPVAGKYTIKVSASDAAGNVAEQSLQITVVAKGQQEEPSSYEITFGPDYNSGAISSYEKSWTATKDGHTWNIENFNNNNNVWEFIRAGRKNTASVAKISTQTSEKMSTVTITVDAVTANNINSITLLVNGTSAGTFAIATGNQTVTIPEEMRALNATYTIVFDCAAGSKNGLITISKVVMSE